MMQWAPADLRFAADAVATHPSAQVASWGGTTIVELADLILNVSKGVHGVHGGHQQPRQVPHQADMVPHDPAGFIAESK